MLRLRPCFVLQCEVVDRGTTSSSVSEPLGENGGLMLGQSGMKMPLSRDADQGNSCGVVGPTLH